MRFRNAVRVTVDNYSSVFKLLLYSLCVDAFFACIGFLIVRLGLDGIITGSPTKALKELASGLFKALASGDFVWINTTFSESFSEVWSAFLELLRHSGGAIAGTVVGLALVYLLSRFVNGLGRVAIAGTIDARMGTFARSKFGGAYFQNIARGSLFEVMYVPLIFVYDLTVAALCALCFFYVPSLLHISGLIPLLVSLCLSVTVCVLCEALKMTLVSAWLPAMVTDGKRAGRAFCESFCAKKHFLRRFASFVVAVYLIVVLNVVCAFATIGSALFLTVPTSFVMLLCLQFVEYYEDNGKKYFIFKRKVENGDGAVTEDFGEKSE